MAVGFPSEPWLRLCSAIEGNAKAAKGGWQWTRSPRPGDLVLFTVSGAANHVGIVEAVEQCDELPPTSFESSDGRAR